MEDSQLAAALSLELAKRVGDQRFAVWFSPQTRLCVETTRLTIHSSDEFVRDLLRRNFADDVRACWQMIAGTEATVDFAVEPKPSTPLVQKSFVESEPTPQTENGSSRKRSPRPTTRVVKTASATEAPLTRAEFTLAGFLVGPSNEYAFRAAELTASRRQQASLVLFHGPTGVGKTHLLRAIAREFRRASATTSAVYLTAEQFTTNFIDAVRGSGLPSFRQKCRGAELLIIDDLQFFGGKDRTLEELQYTIDALVADGRQVVLASDRPIAELQFLGNDLLSRLSAGLTCEVLPPEFATRREIARGIAMQLGLHVGDKILAAVAAQVNSGAREIRGALHRIQAISVAYNEPITQELAERAISELTRHNTRTVRLADVQKAVCDVFGVEPGQLRSDRKSRAVSDPRILAMWLARKYTRAPWSEIAQFFGRRSHSTVISAHRRVEQMINSQSQVGLTDRDCGVEEAIRRLETALRTA